MGLHISYYTSLKKAENQGFNRDCEPMAENGFVLFQNPEFRNWEKGVDINAVYVGEREGAFPCGSYRSYNHWRNGLAKLAGYAAYPGETDQNRMHVMTAWEVATSGPFWELINFSDCEGTIGPVVSSKLARDFAEFDEQAKVFDYNNRNPWFYELYVQFRKAFEAAADNGAVEFH